MEQITVVPTGIVAWLNRAWRTIQTKIKTFDIVPQPPKVATLYTKAKACFDKREVEQAKLLLQQLLTANPKHLEGLIFLGDIHFDRCQFRTAITYYERIIKQNYKHFRAHNSLGLSWLALGEKRKAFRYFNYVLSMDSENVTANHFVAAAADISPPVTETKYITSLFSWYASSYEHSMLELLKYETPTVLVKLWASVIQHASNNILSSFSESKLLDLGCGTGLFGAEINKITKFARIDGVDLSIEMLDIAKNKNIYTSLNEAEIIEFLQNNNQQYEVIAATDVLIYFGELSKIFANVVRNLVVGGWFIFSVEHLIGKNYKLLSTGRYGHAAEYLLALANQFGLQVCETKIANGRFENNQPVMMNYMVLKKIL